jgi:prophage DNA circulation protein
VSWRDALRPASFRGVAFHVLSHSATFGRRSVLHQFPFRDLPYVEDMGRKAREIRVEGFLLGDDYTTALNALIAAIEQAGPGKLVHPTRGELTVSVTDEGLSVEETTREGGMARVRFSCIESGEARFPTSSVATQDVLRARADDAMTVAQDGFAKRFSLAGLPGWAQNLSIGRAQDLLNQVRSAVAPLANAAAGRFDVLSLLDQVAPGVATLLLGSQSFAGTVAQLLGTLRGGVDAGTAVRILAPLGSYGAGEAHLPAATPLRTREAANRDAMVELVRSAAAIERARAVADLDFADYDEAVRIRDSVVAQMDVVADATLDDALFNTFAALRAAVVRDIAARGANLARLVEVTPPATQPAVVLAYRLYQDAERDADILARNRVVRPGFLPAGTTLEVPSDA